MRYITNFKKIILVLSIIIILNLFFTYGIMTFYPSPKYEDFCKPEIVHKSYYSKEDCESVGGLWEEYSNPVSSKDSSQSQVTGYCEPDFSCRKDYQKAEDIYNRNVFIILTILGTISIIIGFLFESSGAVSLGLSFGGLFSLLGGTMRYWSSMNDYFRFFILGVALVLLIVMGLKKFREDKNEVSLEK